MSRPQIEIDWQLVDDFLMSGSPGTEVASFFSMHPNTFYDRVVDKYKMSFTEYLQQKRSSGEAMLRKQQMHKALGLTKEGDNTLLIWLGKQRLNQSETPQEISIAKETVDQFSAIMKQIDDAQSLASNIAKNNTSNDSIS